MRPTRTLLLCVLTIGVFAVSSAALLVRLADAPALSTAALRMAFAAVPAAALLPWRGRRDQRELGRAEGWLLLLSGLCLALHFATWIASLDMTTVASSVALVTTSPLFVAAYLLVIGEAIPRRTLLAMAICLAGGMLIGYADLLRGPRAIEGDLLALVGAAFAAAYFVFGRRVRPHASLTTYVGVVYPVAAVVLVLLTLVARQPLAGFSGRTWLMLALMAAGPQLVGHSALNWAVGYLSAPIVTIAVLGEPVIATALAWVFLGEVPGAGRLIGGAILLCGVSVGVRSELHLQSGTPAPNAGSLRSVGELH